MVSHLMILNYFPICKPFCLLRPLNFREEPNPSAAGQKTRPPEAAIKPKKPPFSGRQEPAPERPPKRGPRKAALWLCGERRSKGACGAFAVGGSGAKRTLRRRGERKKERNGRSFPRRGKRSKVEFLPTTPGPQPSYSAAGGLLLGFVIQGLIPSLSSGPAGWFALGLRLKLLLLVSSNNGRLQT